MAYKVGDEVRLLDGLLKLWPEGVTSKFWGTLRVVKVLTASYALENAEGDLLAPVLGSQIVGVDEEPEWAERGAPPPEEVK